MPTAASSETTPLMSELPPVEHARPGALERRSTTGPVRAYVTRTPTIAPGPPTPSHARSHSHSHSHGGAGDDDDASDHSEGHSNHNDVLRDIIIGFSDGLTVPFSLTAGLSSLGSTRLVIMGGLAELFSGMISMGLGAYLAAVTERDHYASEERRERWEVAHLPEEEREELFGVLCAYGVSREAARPLIDELCRDREQWVRFMMDFELRLGCPDVNRAWISAATMGLSYFVGGLIPMLPYFVMERATEALWVSVAITFVILLVFGYVKNYVTIRTKKAGLWGAVQTLFIGALAAGTSYVIVRLLDSHGE